MRSMFAVWLLVASCAFNPSGLADDVDKLIDAAATTDGDPQRNDAAEPDARVVDAGSIDAALIDARSIDAAPPTCPTGYTALGTSASRYREVTSTATWIAAASDCNDDDDTGGFTGFTHLVVIGNDAERIALTVPAAITGNTWVGLSDRATEGTFLWVTAEPTNGYPVVGQQPPWDGGDPDGAEAENCVRFKNSFTYEDKPCDSANSYVCECDLFPPR